METPKYNISGVILAVTALLLISFSILQLDYSIANSSLEKQISEYESFADSSDGPIQADLAPKPYGDLSPHWFTSPHNINLAVKQLEWMEYFEPTLNTLGYRVMLLEKSIKMRPTWPNTYFELQHIMNDTTGSIGSADYILKLGSQFGPFDPSINFTLIEEQLANWDKLNADTKVIVIDELLQLIKVYYSHKELGTLVSGSNQYARICSVIKFYDIWIPECY